MCKHVIPGINSCFVEWKKHVINCNIYLYSGTTACPNLAFCHAFHTCWYNVQGCKMFYCMYCLVSLGLFMIMTCQWTAEKMLYKTISHVFWEWDHKAVAEMVSLALHKHWKQRKHLPKVIHLILCVLTALKEKGSFVVCGCSILESVLTDWTWREPVGYSHRPTRVVNICVIVKGFIQEIWNINVASNNSLQLC